MAGWTGRIPFFESFRDAPILTLMTLGREQQQATAKMREATSLARDALAAYSHGTFVRRADPSPSPVACPVLFG